MPPPESATPASPNQYGLIFASPPQANIRIDAYHRLLDHIFEGIGALEEEDAKDQLEGVLIAMEEEVQDLLEQEKEVSGS